MIPVHRLSVHIKRLIAAGYKVGVCRQTETRALKAASENASAPFTRELTGLYTASTWIDDLNTHPYAPDTRAGEQTLMAIVEAPDGTHHDRVKLAVVAVDVATANITYDSFQDAYLRSELETRLVHLDPRELLLTAGLSARTHQVLRAYAARQPSGAAQVRFEERAARLEYADCVAFLTGFLGEMDAGDPTLPGVLALPGQVLEALTHLVQYLEAYRLTSAFRTLSNYRSFEDRTSMLLSQATIENLELMFNATDRSEHGSLFWLLDSCKTPMGKRLLRQWLRRPLTDVHKIRERHTAVDLLRRAEQPVLQRAIALLHKLPDLARGLARVAYALVTPTELVTVLLALNRITHEFEPVAEPALVGTAHPLLDAAIAQLSCAREPVAEALAALRIGQARQNNKVELYADAARYPRITEHKELLAADDAALREHLVELRGVLRRPGLQYTAVSGVENLIEVRAADASKVPAEWVRVSSTRAVVRFHTPTIVRLSKQREQHRELLHAAAHDAFLDFVQQVASHYVEMRSVVTAVAQLDALASLAALASRPGYVMPHVTPRSAGEDELALCEFRHPVTEATMQDGSYVPNDLTLGGRDGDTARAVLLTGPNMGGKSSAVRAVALIAVLAQIGSFVPCREARMACLDGIATRMGAHDDLLRGKSTFMVESEETAQILRSATPHTLVILDEFGRGTSTFDGAALAYAVLRFILERGAAGPKLLFITHYALLGALAAGYPGRLRNMHMAVLQGDAPGEVVFLHKLRDGLAQHALGIHVGAVAGLPPELVRRAQELADTLRRTDEERARHRTAQRCAKLLQDVYTRREVSDETLQEAAELVQDDVTRRP